MMELKESTAIILISTMWLKVIEIYVRLFTGFQIDYLAYYIFGGMLSVALGTIVFGYYFSRWNSKYVYLGPVIWFVIKDIINIIMGALPCVPMQVLVIPIEAVIFALPIGVASTYIVKEWL